MSEAPARRPKVLLPARVLFTTAAGELRAPRQCSGGELSGTPSASPQCRLRGSTELTHEKMNRKRWIERLIAATTADAGRYEFADTSLWTVVRERWSSRHDRCCKHQFSLRQLLVVFRNVFVLSLARRRFGQLGKYSALSCAVAIMLSSV
jgi:hypothetical protein